MPRGESRPSHFALTPLSDGSVLGLWLLCVGLPLSITALAVGIALQASPPEPKNLVAGSVAATLALVVGLVAVTTLPLAWWLHRSAKRLSVGLADGVLELRAAWYHERIPVADLDMSQARVLRLSEQPDLRPALKTNAIALPGFSAGHFRLRRWRTKAFCILTSRDWVLALTERSGRIILLSLQQPKALLDELKRITNS